MQFLCANERRLFFVAILVSLGIVVFGLGVGRKAPEASVATPHVIVLPTVPVPQTSVSIRDAATKAEDPPPEPAIESQTQPPDPATEATRQTFDPTCGAVEQQQAIEHLLVQCNETPIRSDGICEPIEPENLVADLNQLGALDASTFALMPFYYGAKQTELRPEQVRDIRAMVERFTAREPYVFVVLGSASPKGDANANRQLARMRTSSGAGVVIQYLSVRGHQDSRVFSTSLGDQGIPAAHCHWYEEPDIHRECAARDENQRRQAIFLGAYPSRCLASEGGKP